MTSKHDQGATTSASGNYTSFTGYSGYDGDSTVTLLPKPSEKDQIVLESNKLPFYTQQDQTNGTWTIFLRGEHFPAVIDGMITRFDVAKDLVNRYNACIAWFINKYY